MTVYDWIRQKRKWIQNRRSVTDFKMLGELLLHVDHHKDARAACEHLTFAVQYLSEVRMLTPDYVLLTGINGQFLAKGNGLQILHVHRFGKSQHVAQLVYLSHSFIEDGCNDPAMSMARRS